MGTSGAHPTASSAAGGHTGVETGTGGHLLGLLAVTVLLGGAYMYTRPAAALPGRDSLVDEDSAFGSEAAHRRKSGLADPLSDASLDAQHELGQHDGRNHDPRPLEIDYAKARQQQKQQQQQQQQGQQEQQQGGTHHSSAERQVGDGTVVGHHHVFLEEGDNVIEAVQAKAVQLDQHAGGSEEEVHSFHAQHVQQAQEAALQENGQQAQQEGGEQAVEEQQAQQHFEQQQQQAQQLEQQQRQDQHLEAQHAEQQQAEQLPHAGIDPAVLQLHQEQLEAAQQAALQQQMQLAAQTAAGGELVVPPPRVPPSIYDAGLAAYDIHGNVLSLADLHGRATIFVNVASHCGFTESNYRGLTDIYDRYHNYGLEVLAFPCNQFGNQEPGTPEEIQAFVDTHFQSKFPLMGKVEVNGPQTHPIFAFLKEHTPPLPGHPANEDINWNFNKFLVDKWGHPVKRYGPDLIQYEIETDLYNELIKPYPAEQQQAMR
ncbi:hypothetical protein N2152v2_001424 [Parachlorella kessleri]